jgi:hypothetical protein
MEKERTGKKLPEQIPPPFPPPFPPSPPPQQSLFSITPFSYSVTHSFTLFSVCTYKELQTLFRRESAADPFFITIK